MIVRRATAEDRDAVRGLLREASLPQEDLFQTSTVVFIAEDELMQGGTTLLGSIGLEPYGADGLLRSLAVASDQRNRGLAQTLIQTLEDHATTVGIDRLYLLTTTAEGYFRRLGWIDVERHSVPETVRASQQFVEICPASANCLVKSLA